MYQAYWGLAESPFRGHLDLRFFHQAPAQDEALARLEFLVGDGRTLGLLLGVAGSGKTLVLETFARQLGRIDRQTAFVSLLGTNVRDMLWSLSSQLAGGVESGADEFKLQRVLTDHLTANRYQRIGTVILLDDADEARGDVLAQVLRLAQVESSRDGRLTIVLAAQPGRLDRLGHRLLELAELRVDLDGWELDDTAAFIKASLSAAGRTSPIFTDAALGRLQELTGGIPRRVKQLADLALLAGAGQNLVQIDADTLESVFYELGVVSPAAPIAEI